MSKLRKSAGILCLAGAFLTAAITGKYYFDRFQDYKHSKETYEEIRDNCTSVQNPVLGEKDKAEKEDLLLGSAGLPEWEKYRCIDVDSESLLFSNEDYVGWIYIPGTEVSYPVVMGEDNTEYLHKDFTGEYSFPGTLFMDFRCPEGVLNHHSIIYGHNMRNGTMFAAIKDYQTQEFWEEHPILWFITPKYKLLYKVFSCTMPSPYDHNAYAIQGVDFLDNEQFGAMVEALKDASVIAADVPVGNRDYVMTLSTCTNDSSTRCAVHAVLLGVLDLVPEDDA